MFKAFSKKYLERVKHVWGEGRVWGGSEIQHWLQHPLVQERINLKVAGTPGVNRFEYFLNRYLKDKMPVERALDILGMEVKAGKLDSDCFKIFVEAKVFDVCKPRRKDEDFKKAA